MSETGCSYEVPVPHKWWSTLKFLVFGSRSSLPPHVGRSKVLACESVCKADLLSDRFDSKRSKESVDPSLICHPSPSLNTFKLWSTQVKRLLLERDPYDVTDSSGMFPRFLKRTADLPTHVSVWWCGGFFV